MFRELEAKYKAEVNKFTGFALMSPFSIKVTNILIQDNFRLEYSSYSVLSWLLVTPLLLLGIVIVYRGLEILEEYQNQSYSLERSK